MPAGRQAGVSGRLGRGSRDAGGKVREVALIC